MLALQSQEAPLQQSALSALEHLKRGNAYNDRLQSRLAKAIELITETSTQINDRATDENSRYTKRRNRLVQNGGIEDAEDKQKNETFQSKVETLTNKMDKSIRKVIDDKIWLEDLPDALDHVRRKAVEVSRGQSSTQATTQQTQDEMDIETDQLLQVDQARAPTAVLEAAFSTNRTKWSSKTLTDKYSKHNDYTGWYRFVYDARHPGENAPPMPHSSMWFAEEENGEATNIPRGSQARKQTTGAKATRGNPAGQSDNESDIEIAAERIRVTCPITLQPYKDPVASAKCPHAFERSAMLEMFKHTTEHLPWTPDQLTELSQIRRPQDRKKREQEIGTRMVRCPECSVPLTEKDLHPDPVLLRKVNRILEKERQAQNAEHDDDVMDAEDDDDGPPRGTQRRNVVHLGSSPARSMKRQSGRIMKNERVSMVPATQLDVDED